MSRFDSSVINSIVLSISLLLAVVLFIGCKQNQGEGTATSATESTAQDSHEEEEFHSHHVGPKGGVLAVLGHHQFHVEFLPDEASGAISALVYDDRFKPTALDAKELTLNIMVAGQPKQFTFLVDNDGSDGKVATYKLTDAELAKLLKTGWEGNAQVSITVKGNPASGGLAQPMK